MQRNTEQRATIRAVFEDADRPLSVQEVFEGAKRQLPRIGIATIYRNLKALVGSGWLASVELPGEPSRYEVAGKGHHHHFYCQHCSRVFEINKCLPQISELTPPGFSLEVHEIILYGSCEECNLPG